MAFHPFCVSLGLSLIHYLNLSSKSCVVKFVDLRTMFKIITQLLFNRVGNNSGRIMRRGVKMSTCDTANFIWNSIFFIRIIPVTCLTHPLIANNCLIMYLFLMDTTLASLPKSLLATIDSTYKWFFSWVSIRVLYKILRERKWFSTVVALVRFYRFVNLHVSLKRVFRFELRLAIEDIAQEILVHLFIINGIDIFQ